MKEEDEIYMKGSAKLKAKDYQGAIDYFQLAIKKNKSHVVSIFGLGFAQLHLGQFTEAAQSFSRVIDMCKQKDQENPNYINAFFNRGYVRSHQPRPKHAQAVSDFTEVLKIEPDHAKAFYSRGKSKAALGEYKSALEDFQNALKYEGAGGKYYELAMAEIKKLPDNVERLRLK